MEGDTTSDIDIRGDTLIEFVLMLLISKLLS